MAKLISKTYGDALFELALEENKLDEIAADVDTLTVALKENTELSKFMNHPKIEKTEKCQVMNNILKGNVADEITGFFNIIIAKDRYNEIQSILEYFSNCVKEYKNIGSAHVLTAAPLNDDQKTAVEKRLLETTQYEQVEITYQVDESLIGGMVIRIGDRVVDSSIKTKLYELTKDLSKIQLAVSKERQEG